MDIEQYDHGDLWEIRKVLVEELPKLEIEIMFFPLDSSDENFNFLLKKATNFRDMLKKIDNILNQTGQ